MLIKLCFCAGPKWFWQNCIILQKSASSRQHECWGYCLHCYTLLLLWPTRNCLAILQASFAIVKYVVNVHLKIFISINWGWLAGPLWPDQSKDATNRARVQHCLLTLVESTSIINSYIISVYMMQIHVLHTVKYIISKGCFNYFWRSYCKVLINSRSC